MVVVIEEPWEQDEAFDNEGRLESDREPASHIYIKSYIRSMRVLFHKVGRRERRTEI